MDRQIKALKEIVQDLEDDCNAFDSGNERKAKDIAGRIRTLVKDGPSKSTVSLLSQLQKKNIFFKNSASEYTTKPGLSYFNMEGSITNSLILVSCVYMGLISKNFNKLDEFSFLPFCKTILLKTPGVEEKIFSEWWDQIIFEDPYSGYKLSRKDLILSISEKDGFAHFDLKLNKEYQNFLESDSLKLIINGQKIKFKNNPAKNSIRQIGYEVLETIKTNLSDILV